MNKYSVLSVVTGVAIVMSGMSSAMAGTSTGNVRVGATTAALCTAPGAYTVGLGNYNGTAAIVTPNVMIAFRCTKNTPFTMRLKPNGGVQSTNGTLKTTPPNTTPIAYTLDSAEFSGAGNGLTRGAGTVGGDPVVSVAAGQSPIPGTYSDVITIEVTY